MVYFLLWISLKHRVLIIGQNKILLAIMLTQSKCSICAWWKSKCNKNLIPFLPVCDLKWIIFSKSCHWKIIIQTILSKLINSIVVFKDSKKKYIYLNSAIFKNKNKEKTAKCRNGSRGIYSKLIQRRWFCKI